MAQAKAGNAVRIHYTGKLEDGTIFDSSIKRDPIEFTIGDGKVIPGFEDGVVDMEPGQKKTIKIECEQAYGPHRQELVITVERTKIPDTVKPEMGQMLQFKKQDDQGKETGEIIAFCVTGITDTHLTLDANHPLAGKDLTFDLELVEIV